MPDLFSRLDNQGWLTPSVADILDPGASSSEGNSSVRTQINELQQALAERGTPVRIVNIRLAPSYTLFIAQPEGRTQAELLRRSLRDISDDHPDWTLGLLPELRDTEGVIGLLLRTTNHQPLSLRRLLGHNRFRDHRSTLNLVMGITLEEQLISRDLASSGHLLFVGSGNTKRHFLDGLLATLLLLNTPTELRVAFIGNNALDHSVLSSTPHLLGRLLTTPTDGQRLFSGLIKEVKRRADLFQKNEVENIARYNSKQIEAHSDPLPRIVVMFDSLADDAWNAAKDDWVRLLTPLLRAGVASGIHFIFTADEIGNQPVLDSLSEFISTTVIARAVAIASMSAAIRPFTSILRFTDAFIRDTSRPEPLFTPVELYVLSDEELERTVNYWQQAADRRLKEGAALASSGLTGYLSAMPDAEQQLLEEQQISRARALAAYLGWLGPGPLQDVLGLDQDMASDILDSLQAKGVLESGEGGVLRFVRLQENPLDSNSAKPVSEQGDPNAAE